MIDLRGLVVGLIALACSGCSATPGLPRTDAVGTARPPASSPASATKPDTATTASGSAPGPSDCMNSQLGLAYDHGSGAGGVSYSVYRLINTSRTSCALSGYPTVAVLDRDGRVVQHPATPDSGPATSVDAPLVTVTLDPGAKAGFTLASVDNVPNADCPKLDDGVTLQVSLPDTSSPIDLPGRYAVCDLSVGPLRPLTAPTQ